MSDLVKRLQAENEALARSLSDLLDYTDRHRISDPAGHGHDCYELWCMERDHARILLADRTTEDQ